MDKGTKAIKGYPTTRLPALDDPEGDGHGVGDFGEAGFEPGAEGGHRGIYGGQHRFRESLTATLGSTIIVPQSAIAEKRSNVFRLEGHAIGAVAQAC